MAGKHTHVNAQDGKKSITLSQQTTDAPVLPVPQLEILHGFRPDLVDWVVKETSDEAAYRRSESHRVNTFTFIERLVGQIFAFGIGIAGAIGGAYNNPNSPPMRRKLSADYLVEVANDDDIKRAKPKAHKYALQALVGAIDRNDLSPHNRLLYDDLTKGVSDDLSIPWGEMLFSKGVLTNYDLQQSKELD